MNNATDTFKVLAEPHRRAILELVRDRERGAGEIAARFAITRTAVSQHLSLLREAGLLTERREGTRRLYRARREGMGEARVFLESFWDEGLERLKREAEHEQRRRDMAGKTLEATAIERELRIEASPEIIYEHLTEPEKITRWMGRAAQLDPRPGGIFRCEISSEHVALGEYVEAVPGRRVVFTWGWEADDVSVPAGSSTVEVDLIPEGRGTLLRFVHRDLPAASVDGHTAGWDHYLARLLLTASGGDPGPDTFPGGSSGS